mgnify:CR=1 FL=1
MFVLHRDPNGAYLEVTIEELCQAGIHPGELTDKFRRNKQWMYLPQGDDIRLFIDRWKARFPDDEMDFTERWGASFIRRLKHHHPMTPEQVEAKILALGYTMEELIDATR